MKLGKEILKFRKKNGLSQEELGNKIGVTRQTISNWELGETTPNISQLSELAKIFDISVDELIGNKNSISRDNSLVKTIMLYSLVLIFGILLVICIVLLFKEKDKNVIKYYKTTTQVTSKVKTDDTFIRTYKVLNLEKVKCDGKLTGCDETTYKVTLNSCSGETQSLQISNSLEFKKLENNKTYEFTFEPDVGEVYYEDTITSIFAFNHVVKIEEINKNCNEQKNDKIKTRSN